MLVDFFLEARPLWIPVHLPLAAQRGAGAGKEKKSYGYRNKNWHFISTLHVLLLPNLHSDIWTPTLCDVSSSHTHSVSTDYSSACAHLNHLGGPSPAAINR